MDSLSYLLSAVGYWLVGVVMWLFYIGFGNFVLVGISTIYFSYLLYASAIASLPCRFWSHSLLSYLLYHRLLRRKQYIHPAFVLDECAALNI
jgi:amino acid transporter